MVLGLSSSSSRWSHNTTTSHAAGSGIVRVLAPVVLAAVAILQVCLLTAASSSAAASTATPRTAATAPHSRRSLSWRMNGTNGSSTSTTGLSSSTMSWGDLLSLSLLRGGAAASAASTAITSLDTSSSSSPSTTNTPIAIDNDDDDEDYVYAASLDRVKSKVLLEATAEIDSLRLQIEVQGKIVDGLGVKADTIINNALEAFALQAPAPPVQDGSSRAGKVYDQKAHDIEASLDAVLQVLYMKQLGLLRERAIQTYRTALKTSSNSGSKTAQSEYDIALQIDTQFVQAAMDATRNESTLPSGSSGNTSWDYSHERSFLQAVLQLTTASQRQIQDEKLQAAQQQQTAMQFLQSQQQMIQQLQQQLYGQSSPWNIGMAYRIPDTHFNIQGSYQQGRANVQLSCVPDEYAPMLGPSGFTNGVGPGNLGLSLNLSM